MALSWSGASDDQQVTGYKVFVDQIETADVSGESTTLTNLLPDTQYTISVEAYDLAGNQSDTGPSIVASTDPDTTLPVWNAGVLQVDVKTTTGFEISWTGATDDVAVVGYRIYANDAEVLDVGVVTNAVVSGLSPATSYTLRVEAYDAEDNVSICLLYTSPSPRDRQKSRMPSSA